MTLGEFRIGGVIRGQKKCRYRVAIHHNGRHARRPAFRHAVSSPVLTRSEARASQISRSASPAPTSDDVSSGASRATGRPFRVIV